MNIRRQRGAALIIALVIVSMATILASTLVWEAHLERRRTAMQVHGAEALANALSVEEFVRALLFEDAAQNEFDHLQEPWAQQGNIFPIEGGSLTGAVTDLQGRFNINNLYDWENGEAAQDQVDGFRNLVRSIGLEDAVVDAVLDWIDPDIEPRAQGAEDNVYLRNTPAYRTANGPIADIDELRLLANMNAEQFAALAPYVTALPSTQPTKININTAAPELLTALDPELPPDAAVRLVDIRNQEGFETIEAAEDVAGVQLDENLFDVNSNWFRLNVLAVVGSSQVTMYSVLHRDTDAGAVLVESRSLGTP